MAKHNLTCKAYDKQEPFTMLKNMKSFINTKLQENQHLFTSHFIPF